MKKCIPFVLAAIITLLLFNSCIVTEKQKQRFLANNCERKDSTVTITEEIYKYKDTTVYITQQGEPIYITNPCDSLGRLKDIKATTNKGGIKGSVKTVGNSLVFTCETDSLKARINWLEREIKVATLSHTESKIVRMCERKHSNTLDNAARWFSLFTIVAISAAIIIRRFV
jgi:hypothetical protein